MYYAFLTLLGGILNRWFLKIRYWKTSRRCSCLYLYCIFRIQVLNYFSGMSGSSLILPCITAWTRERAGYCLGLGGSPLVSRPCSIIRTTPPCVSSDVCQAMQLLWSSRWGELCHLTHPLNCLVSFAQLLSSSSFLEGKMECTVPLGSSLWWHSDSSVFLPMQLELKFSSKMPLKSAPRLLQLLWERWGLSHLSWFNTQCSQVTVLFFVI